MLDKYLPYIVGLVTLGLLLYLLTYLKVWAGLRRIHRDMLLDPNDKVTINNSARVMFMYAALFVFIFTSFKVDLNPLNVEPRPINEAIFGIVMAAILGLTWINKPTAPVNNSTIEVKTENTNIGPVNPKQPDPEKDKDEILQG